MSSSNGQDPRITVTLSGLRPAGPAAVRRESLRTDARILAHRGLTWEAIASRLGVSRATVARWLS